MVVRAPVEHGCGVLADGSREERLAAGVFVSKVRYVVYEASHGDQRASFGLVNEVVPLHQRQHRQRLAPVQHGKLAVELLLFLLKLALVDLVLRKGAEVAGQTEKLPGGYTPLIRVVRQPSCRVAIVRGEL